jgi:D-glycero-D-manno-heptose 1,7-bisphosphate phosphatase
VDTINAYIVAAIGAAGGRVDGVYICPHPPGAACTCRKPAPGLLLQAASDLDLDLTTSVMIGDAASDVQAALAAGVKPVFVLTGLAERLPQELALARRLNATVYASLAAAADQLADGNR